MLSYLESGKGEGKIMGAVAKTRRLEIDRIKLWLARCLTVGENRMCFWLRKFEHDDIKLRKGIERARMGLIKIMKSSNRIKLALGF